MHSRLIRLLIASTVLSIPLGVGAESSARQRFVVHVLPRVSINAPPAAAVAELPPDQTQIQFPEQVWDISSNIASGATVQFATEQSFHNLDDDTIRRDAQLNVSISSQSTSGAWAVTHAQAATDHVAGLEAATVQVHSTRPGSAAICLTVLFLADDSVLAPGGEYLTTVVGTITAN